MNLKQAKVSLDKVINKGRVHFYKPFQIAEILRMHRNGQLDDLTDLASYKNVSRRWRDDVSTRLVGRISTSSARYQDDVFNDNACPPDAMALLGEHNLASGGEVEAYVYRMFESKVSSIGAILSQIREATPDSFDLGAFVDTFESRPGLKRSIDKVFEITVYALFATIVRALDLQVSLSIRNRDEHLIEVFGDFLEKVAGLKKGETSITLPASLFRLGATNAADRGLDMVANFGPVIQVKHLTLDKDAVADICDGLTADRIVIVCKDSCDHLPDRSRGIDLAIKDDQRPTLATARLDYLAEVSNRTTQPVELARYQSIDLLLCKCFKSFLQSRSLEVLAAQSVVLHEPI